MVEIITNRKTHAPWYEIKAAIQNGSADWLHSGAMISVELKNGKPLVLDVARDPSTSI